VAASLREQLDKLKLTLKELAGKFTKTTPFLSNVVDWLVHFQGTISEGEWVEIRQLISTCFAMTDDEVKQALVPPPEVEGHIKASPFDELIPEGWIADYVHETLETESPTVFHFTCAAVALGALVNRRVWLSKGHYRIFPNLNAILIAPTGRCRKSSAINIAYDIITRAGYDRVVLGASTPEAFVVSLGSSDPATCFIISREMATFFKKAKYMDGMVPLITDLIDAPDTWRSLTIARSKLVLHNVAISGIYGTTMDWLNKNMPADIFGGGFMRRHLIVAQERTDRVFAIPRDIDAAKNRLAERAKLIAELEGEFAWASDSAAWYIDWYSRERSKADHIQDERMSGYMQSKPDHLLRLAMIFELSRMSTTLTVTSMKDALKVLEWLEQFLPTIFGSMDTTQIGEMEEKILRYIKNAGGRMSHSDLLRRVSKYMTAFKFKDFISTLKESELITERDKTALEPRSYYLTSKALGKVE
jgi:hypothetical protein